MYDASLDNLFGWLGMAGGSVFLVVVIVEYGVWRINRRERG